MQDQAARLQTTGIPAALLNSSLSPGRRGGRWRAAAEGELPIALSFARNGWRGRIQLIFAAGSFDFWRSTRRTAFRSGGVNSGQNTGSSLAAQTFSEFPLPHLRPARRERCGTTFGTAELRDPDKFVDDFSSGEFAVHVRDSAGRADEAGGRRAMEYI